jgi:DNA repair protein RadD
MTELWDYQQQVIADFEREVAAGHRSVLMVSPTASGKTVMFCEIIRRNAAQLKSVLVIAHRREIITQTSEKLTANGIRHGIILAGTSPRPLERVQVASIDTLRVRALSSTAMSLPPADLMVIDEAHHAVARTYRKLIDAYPDAIVLGATATPCRGDGRGLGGVFEVMIEAPQAETLIQKGRLVRCRVYAPVDPDLRGVGTRTGDYIESQLADRMDRPKLIGDIVTHWHKYGERRKTVVFAVNVAHSIHLRDEFIRSGVRAEHIDGTTAKDERDATLARLASGEIELVANCMVLTEGWNMPDVGCGILARPTKQMGLFHQMVGRIRRSAPGKTDAILLDHSGAVFRHGLPEDPIEWTLESDKRAENPTHVSRLHKPEGGLLECVKCSALRLGGQPCPSCGFMPQRPARYVPIGKGELGLVNGGRAKASDYSPAARAQWHGMLAAIAAERGYKPGWAAVNYKEKFGAWPPFGNVAAPIPPSPEVLSWVRSRMIAYAKRKEAAA